MASEKALRAVEGREIRQVIVRPPRLHGSLGILVKEPGLLAACPCDVRDERVGSDLERDLERLYREHGGRLWRSLVLSTGSREVADDAVAEAFAQALARGDALRDPLAWIWRVAFRIAAGEMKGTRRTEPLTIDLGEDAPEPAVDLVRALSTLTPHQRAAVVLADYVGYGHRDVARNLGSSVSAVGVHVHRARSRLRRLLEEDDG